MTNTTITKANTLTTNTEMTQPTTITHHGIKHIYLTPITAKDEVICLRAGNASDIACDLFGASKTLSDIAHTLHLIQSGELNQDSINSLARLAQSSAETWADFTHDSMQKLNKGLRHSRMGEVGKDE